MDTTGFCLNVAQSAFTVFVFIKKHSCTSLHVWQRKNHRFHRQFSWCLERKCKARKWKKKDFARILKENARGVLQIIHNFATVNDSRHAAAFTAARFRALRCKRHKMMAQEVQDSDARGTRWWCQTLHIVSVWLQSKVRMVAVESSFACCQMFF